MKKIVYCLYACYLDVYETPIVYNFGNDEKDLQEGFRRLIVTDPDKAFAERLNEKEICILGTWDDSSGTIELKEHPVRLAHLASLFPKGYLSSKEARNA